ncbi:AMIN domain-containing protein [Sulfurimonas sp. SAG-AH-194-C21]|nr:AMIN domain-containing protein [Sulfurimonas sp. SAG-AH-194-C21]MDF1883010.1 AMIN domain-containing protein [Sulfurimonas sp. SAG-AH-194-C21]
MIKILLIYLVLISSLTARENPFFPSKNETDIPFSTNKTSVIEPLKRATLSLPSTARTLESVTVTYKNLDGSIVSQKVSLGNSVDWHLPIFISQNIGGNEKKITSKVVTKKNEKFTKITSLSFISLYEKKQLLKIITKDKMLRNFLLTKPHRIVCDFARNIDIRSYEKKSKTNTRVTQVRIGNHKGYYRVVIELDGHYKYKLTNYKNGYYINLL